MKHTNIEWWREMSEGMLGGYRGKVLLPIYIGIHICIVCTFFANCRNAPLDLTFFCSIAVAGFNFGFVWVLLVFLSGGGGWIVWVEGCLRWQRYEIAALNFFAFAQLLNFNWIVSVSLSKKRSSFKDSPAFFTLTLCSDLMSHQSVLRIQLNQCELLSQCCVYIHQSTN